MWSWREELNLQPSVYKTDALPLSYASAAMRVHRGSVFWQAFEWVWSGLRRRCLTFDGGWSILPP